MSVLVRRQGIIAASRVTVTPIVTTFRIHPTASDISIGDANPDRSAYPLAAWPGAGADETASLSASTTITYAYATRSGVPNLTAWEAGTYTFNLNVSAVGTNCSAQLILKRLSSAGAVLATLATGTAITAAGTATVTWSPGSNLSVNATDRMAIYVVASRGSGGGGTRAVTWTTDANSTGEFPFTTSKT